MAKADSSQYIAKTDAGLLKLTKDGRDFIAPLVTNVDSNVYSFTTKASPLAIAASMARLSRNSNDLRTIYADEFAAGDDSEEGLVRRVVTQYGDDSVMQLYSMPIVFEGISNIATKAVERGRFAAYLEQSTRYLRFDLKNEAGEYAYYVPEEFDDETKKLYKQWLDEIFDIYSELYQKLLAYYIENSDVPEAERDGAFKRACHAQACDGIRAILPSATKSTVGVVGSSQAIQNMIFHMEAHELPEMRTLAKKTLESARGVAPVFFERTDRPDRGKLITGHKRTTREAVEKLAAKYESKLASTAPREGTFVELLSVDGTEDEVIAKIFTDHSDQPLSSWQKVVAKLSDKEKQEILTEYVGDRYNRRAKPGRAFEFPHYLFEIQCDYGAFRDIQRHRVVDGLHWQRLQTGLGHVKHPVIDEAGLTKQYDKAFAISHAGYDELKKRGYDAQAQYLTLFGHNMRFNTKMDARALVHSAELRTTPQGHPSYRNIYQKMHEEVAKVHPNIAKAMIFVSQEEDETLARLGAEKYNAAKFGDEDERKI